MPPDPVFPDNCLIIRGKYREIESVSGIPNQPPKINMIVDEETGNLYPQEVVDTWRDKRCVDVKLKGKAFRYLIGCVNLEAPPMDAGHFPPMTMTVDLDVIPTMN